MSIARPLSTMVLVFALVVTFAAQALAQTQSNPLQVTVQRDLVIVTPVGARQFRVEVFSPGGEPVFDSGFINGQPVLWDMKNLHGQAVPEGIYIVLLSTVTEKGKVRKTIEQVIVWRKGESSSKTESLISNQPEPTVIQDSTGTPGKIAKWTAADLLGDSVVTEDASKIGITTATPAATLHVDGAQPRPSVGDGIDANTLLQTSGGKGGDANGSAIGGRGADISLLAGSGGDSPLGTSGNGGNVTIQAGSSGNGSMTGQSGRVLIAPFVGRVGIGTVSPTEKLTVDGNIQITGGANGLKFSDNTFQTTAGLTNVARDATLAGDGTGSSPLGVASQGIDTIQLKDGGVTALKISAGQVVKSLNTLKDDVTLAAGNNITITPGGNTLTIAATNDGLTAVSHNSTLAGDGTGGNPLGVSIPLNLSGSDPGAILTVSNGSGGLAVTTLGAINTSAHYNIGGNRVLSIAGLSNTFGGVNAGISNTTGNSNAFFGTNAGQSNTAGNFNSFFGNTAGLGNTTGSGNSFFGSTAGLANTTGGANAFFGTAAGQSNTTGSRNALFGGAAGFANVAAADNAFFGDHAGSSNTAEGNSFFGSSAGSSNTTATGNSFFGYHAGIVNTTSGRNSFFGFNAGANSTASDNSFFGFNAGATNTTGGGNSFFGSRAGQANTLGHFNAFFGGLAGFHNTTGGFNAFFGVGAGEDNTTGTGNVFLGFGAGSHNTTGNFNTFAGEVAGDQNTTGTGNVFFGNGAGLSNTTGNRNSYFGTSAGELSTGGDRNTYVGSESAGSDNLTNATAIGARAMVTQSNSLILGSISGTNGANATVKVGIGTTAPLSRLHVVGNLRVTGDAIITGNIAKGGGSFKIDHPLDPENRYLSHSFVESPDMMNIYNGVVSLDRRGRAVVKLPAWFEALNRDFRYQLTALGKPAPNLYIAREVKGNCLEIAGGHPRMKVSWEVTGIRRDAYAEANRIQVEENKPPEEQGTYLYPELFDQRREKSADQVREPVQAKPSVIRKTRGSLAPQGFEEKGEPK